MSGADTSPAVLPDAAWRHRPGLAQLTGALGAGEGLGSGGPGGGGLVRWVGGAVRDTLLGLDVADLDLATTLRPDEVVRRLEGAGIKAIPTGIDHGTITAVTSGTVVEVTTLRRDVATDGRHAVVEFADEWREDAARRDFTINALYADPVSGAISDFFGGIEDLAARRVRFIGDPYRRIAEDHLRILRFFRFHARFGTTIDADGLAAASARANDLMALSRERIAAELLKLLVAGGAVPVVTLMQERGIFRPVLPEIDAAGVARLAALAAAEARAGVAPAAIRRLATLLEPATAEGVGARLKLSNAERRRLVQALAPVGDEGVQALAYRVGVESAVDRLLLRGDAIDALRDWVPPVLPIGGGALVARGLAKGPEVARTLRRVEDRWIAEGFPDATRAGVIADEEVAGVLAGAR